MFNDGGEKKFFKFDTWYELMTDNVACSKIENYNGNFVTLFGNFFWFSVRLFERLSGTFLTVTDYVTSAIFKWQLLEGLDGCDTELLKTEKTKNRKKIVTRFHTFFKSDFYSVSLKCPSIS